MPKYTRAYVRPLTGPEEAFCVHYFTHDDQVAAVRAAYDCSKVVEKTIINKASLLLTRPQIRLRLQQLRDAAASLAVVNEAEVLRNTAHIAFSDPLGVVDGQGNLRKLKDMTPDMRAAVAAIEFEQVNIKVDKGDGEKPKITTTTRVKRVKFWDKNSAQDRLMKHLGMYERDNVQRRGLFDGVPASEAKQVMERISEIESRRFGVAGNSEPGHPKSPLH